MNPYAEHEAGIAELQDELGEGCPVMKWYRTKTAVEPIRILPGSLLLRSKNSPGGFSLDSDFVCVCLTSAFSELPKSNQSLEYLGKKLAIDSVTVLAGGLHLRIRANDDNQGI